MNVEDELMIITMEECAELQMALSKRMRFGGNMDNIKQELGDVAAMLGLFLECGLITDEELQANAHKKLLKLRKWSNLPIPK